MAATNAAWYDDPTLVRGLGNALASADVLENQQEFQEYFTYPQRYNEFFEAWEENNFPDPEHDNWDAFVEAISDDDDADDGEPE